MEPISIARGDQLHRLLVAELSSAGCFRRATARSLGYGAFILGAFAAAYATLLAEPGFAGRAAVLVALAFISVHAGFLAHEAGHGALAHSRFVASCVGQVFNTLLTGLCYSYFSHIHRRHHPHCNDRARDPDMQSGVFSLYPESARDKRGLGRAVSRRQAVLLWILVWLQACTLKLDSLQFLWRNARSTRADQAFMALHFALWLLAPAMVLGLQQALVNYSMVSLLIGGYLGAIFLVTHIGTRVIEPQQPVSFFAQQLSTTRNLGASRLQGFLSGGLNSHIEHHLFPSMPTARLRAARPITREFCRRHGLAYREMSWFGAAREVARHLRSMSKFVPS